MSRDARDGLVAEESKEVRLAAERLFERLDGVEDGSHLREQADTDIAADAHAHGRRGREQPQLVRRARRAHAHAAHAAVVPTARQAEVGRA